MVGRELGGAYYRTDWENDYDDEVVFSIKNVTTEGVKNLNVDLHKGEILAFCGLSDSGIHESRSDRVRLTTPKEGRSIPEQRQCQDHTVYSGTGAQDGLRSEGS